MNSKTIYEVNRRLDGFSLYELKDQTTDSRIVICPERGGIVVSCQLYGRELLYLDRDTFLNPQSNIRGGIPVLFPIAGQLADGKYEWNGTTYAMKNHGVARTLPWEVIATNTNESASITLSLHSNADTLDVYPFEFELIFTYRLTNGVLSIEQQYKNLSYETMPMVAGFHPYFAADRKNLTYETDATLVLDYNDMREKPFNGLLDLNNMVESAALLDANKTEIAFSPSEGCNIRLSYSQEFKYVVLWSVEDKPFVCVEPWTALNEAFNNRGNLLMVEPGDTLNLALQIACEK